MRIGIYGGTFDPPHMGHMEAARWAMSELGLDRLLFVPAAVPPHKQLPDNAASPEARLKMVRLMADGLNLVTGSPGAAECDPIELTREGKSYTADTLAQLRARFPGDELWLLVGTDMFLTLPNWREPEKIVSVAGIAAFAREVDEENLLEDQAKHLRETLGAQVRVLTLPQIIDISSTRLRELLRGGEGKDLLWATVYGYILREGLYGVKADLKRLSDDDLRCASWSMVKAKRIPHIRGTEEEAVRLALRWGVDPIKARRAGILHDCTKYLNLTEQLQLCQKYGIVLDDLEKRAVKLLHSKTGAAIARHVFGEDDEVYHAIFWHTTGRADMSLLAEILYLADYIEPTREQFDGLEEMRKLAYENLDAALLLGCELTITDMEERGMPVHTNTLQARAWLKGRSK